MFVLALKKLPHFISFSLAVMFLSACSEHPNAVDKTGNTQHTQSTPQQLFALEQVSLSASPFLHAQQTNVRYLLALHPDQLLAPYLREAGLDTKAASYGNWENSGLDGHIGGHY